MPGVLHITNGDSVSLQSTGLGGEVLTWQDVLHEGPVPAGLTLEGMRPIRAEFLAKLTGRPRNDVLAGLERRDQALSRFSYHDEVILWFEHDLYDQLQLIQILDWFSRRPLNKTLLSLISSDRYLGPLRPEELLPLYLTRRPTTTAQLHLAHHAWRAFCAPQPVPLASILREDTSALPYLQNALARHLEQFPSVQNGLSRTERQILEISEAGASRVGEIFMADQGREDAIFMGDIAFLFHIRGLANCRVPLLRILKEEDPFGNTKVAITAAGRSVLRGEQDHVRFNGIDRWLGGVHLEGHQVWRWDAATRSAVAPGC